MSKRPIIRLRPLPPGAVAAIDRGSLPIAAELTGAAFGDAWLEDADWAHDYLAYLQRYQPLAAMFLVVRDNEAIGRVGWTQFTSASSYEISYVILPPWRRQGVALASVRQLLKLLRLTREVTFVTAVIKQDNDASRGVLDKLGFSYTKSEEGNDFYELHLVD